MKSVWLAISVSILLLGCNSSKFGAFKTAFNQTDSNLLAPGRLFIRGLPQTDDSYSQGIRDGCETFLGVVGSGTLRLIPAKIDGFRLSEDIAYARGFIDGGNYCTHYLDWDIH